ncbi:hypothetical protein [Streptomyces sp. RFCAC02]|uniref:hypothetical protein n=1 Tax=Streptomyces sp. RFCAC02 TaxID=2499143 RepID=UPI00101F2CC7|nr:hypothetical protein [Streptomyces sp. RFCAC02]
MGYRERRVALIAKHAAPHLQPGEQIQTGFIASSSARFSVRVWTFVATDRAILIVSRGGVQRLPRDIWFGAPSGMYHGIVLDRAYKVHRDYFAEVRAADEALRDMQFRSAPPDPDHP